MIFFFFLTKLKENRLENISMIQWPGENLGLREEKDGNIPLDLIFESIMCPFVNDLWRSVKEPILWDMIDFVWGGSSFSKFFKMWLVGSLKEHMRDLLAIFWRWSLIGISSARASMLSEGEVLNAPSIQMAALLCILLRILKWYDNGALL